MSKNNNTTKETQGVPRETGKKQAVSASYTLKQLKGNIERAREANLMSKKTYEAMTEMHKDMVLKSMGYGIKWEEEKQENEI